MTQTTQATSGAAPETEVRELRPARSVELPATLPPQGRDCYFDNAKFLAILLVVAGHAIVSARSTPLASAVYLFVYMFHMPVFILITGYFSKNFSFTGDKARKLVVTLLVPYLVFQSLYLVFAWQVGGKDLELSLLEPYWLMWFLPALAIWRMLTPVWMQLRWPLAVAVAVSLLGFIGGVPHTLSLDRAVGFLPFYVLGLMVGPQHFELLKRPVARAAGAVTLLAGLGVAFLVHSRMTHKWLFWKSGHADLGVDNLTGTGMRVAMLVAAVALVAAFMAVVPARRTWFSDLGATTLYAYLLHGFVVRLLRFNGWLNGDFVHSVPGVLALLAGGLVLGTLLCTRPVRRLLRWAVEPRMDWLFNAPRAR